MHKLFFIIFFIFILSCTSEKPADVSEKSSEAKDSKTTETLQKNIGAGSYSIEIVPQDATRKSTLKVVPNGFKISDAEITWTVNGKVLPDQNTSQFNAEQTWKGDEVQARAIVQDKELLSNEIYIKNTPPEINSYKILPGDFKPGDTLSVEVVSSDFDDDKVTILYEWTKNEEPAGVSNRLETPLKRGDKISVRMTPYDEEDYGRPVVRKWEIANMSPMIMGDKAFNFDGKVYSFQVRATDPDEDPLTFSLKSAPSGMKINPETGAVTWDVPPDFTGDVQVTVAVTDGVRGETTREITISIKQPETKTKK